MTKGACTITLPPPLYYTLPELCQRWGCHEDRPFLYMDAGLLVPSALVPKHELPLSVRDGIAPNVCVVLDNYRELVWSHEAGDAVALISGKFTAVSATGTGWRTLELNLPEELCINRRSLVVLDAEREEVEETLAAMRPKRPNGAERASTDLVIKALAMQAYPDDLAHPYRMASKVCASLEFEGAKISRETVARKLKSALASKGATDEVLA